MPVMSLSTSSRHRTDMRCWWLVSYFAMASHNSLVPVFLGPDLSVVDHACFVDLSLHITMTMIVTNDYPVDYPVNKTRQQAKLHVLRRGGGMELGWMCLGGE